MDEAVPGHSTGWMLLLDTCGEPGEVGLVNLSEWQGDAAPNLSVRSLPGRQTQERLLPEINALLKECGADVAGIGTVAAVNGPGSFTGVRVGLAAAMGLAEALQLPVLQISKLAVLASQHGNGGTLEAWLQAGRGDVFRGRYRGAECLDETMLRAETALQEMVPEGAVVTEPELLALSPQLRLARAGLQQALPLFLQQLREGASINAAQVRANYLRVPDAELALQARLAALQPSA